MHNGVSPTPMTFAESNYNSVAKYVGAEVTTGKGFHENETITIARGIFSTAHTTAHTNINLEAFGFFGNYKVSGVPPKYNGNKTAFGLGGNFKLAFNFTADKSKFGIGINLGLNTEFGEYPDFRKNASNAGLIDNKESAQTNFSLFPFLAFQTSETSTLSLQVTLGYPIGISPSIMISNSNISAWFSYVPTNDNSSDFIHNKFVFGMKYRL